MKYPLMVAKKTPEEASSDLEFHSILRYLRTYITYIDFLSPGVVRVIREIPQRMGILVADPSFVFFGQIGQDFALTSMYSVLVVEPLVEK